jgi:rhodanese-related sulfurtransferase
MIASALIFSFVTAVPAVIPTAKVRPALALKSARRSRADYVSPSQIVTADEAVHMRRELGEQAMLVDVRANGAAVRGMLFPSDTHVPFVRREAPMEFQAHFATNLDDALRTRHLRHDAPVIVYAGSREFGVLAALLLQEHGYTRIYVAI